MDEERRAFYAELRRQPRVDFERAAEAFTGRDPQAGPFVAAALRLAREALQERPGRPETLDEIAAMGLFGMTWGDSCGPRSIVNHALRSRKPGKYLPYLGLLVDGLRKQRAGDSGPVILWRDVVDHEAYARGGRAMWREFVGGFELLRQARHVCPAEGGTVFSISARAYINPFAGGLAVGEAVMLPYTVLEVRGTRAEVDLRLVDLVERPRADEEAGAMEEAPAE